MSKRTSNNAALNEYTGPKSMARNTYLDALRKSGKTEQEYLRNYVQPYNVGETFSIYGNGQNDVTYYRIIKKKNGGPNEKDYEIFTHIDSYSNDENDDSDVVTEAQKNRFGGGRRKSRKQRKSRKSRKSRKQRKQRKSHKHRK